MKGIYKITSPSGKVYIGQSVNIKVRKRHYSSNKKDCQPKIHNSIKKYGWPAHIFEVIHELPENSTRSVLNAYEILYMDQYRACGVELMNVRDGGGSNAGMAKESIEKMVATRKANGSYAQTEAQKLARSIKNKGKPFPVVITAEMREKGIAKLRGRKPSTESLEKNRQSQLGRKHSEETKRKIGASKIGRPRLDMIGSNNPKWRARP